MTLAATASIAASFGTLWSEITIYTTGCGPINMPDVVERICYQIVLFVAGSCWFIRLAFQSDMASWVADWNSLGNGSSNHEKDTTGIVTWQIRVAELVAYVAVAGAFLVLWKQMQEGVQMDGLSGIDTEMCKARQAFAQVAASTLQIIHE